MSFLGYSEIEAVKFRINGDREIRESAYVLIESKEQFKGNDPYPTGVNDAALGTTSRSYNCHTCLNTNQVCPCHGGYYNLRIPVINPLVPQERRKWLKAVCHYCGALIASRAQLNKYPRSTRFEHAVKLATASKDKKAIFCSVCKNQHWAIERDKENKYDDIFPTRKQYELKELKRKQIIFPHNEREIYSRITRELIDYLNFDKDYNPNNFTNKAMSIPPVSIRPNLKKYGSTRKRNNDLTSILQHIITENESMPEIIPAEFNMEDRTHQELAEKIYNFNKDIFNYVKGSADADESKAGGSFGYLVGNKWAVSVIGKLKGKTGYPRGVLLGKRVFKVMRAVITGNPEIQISQVGVSRRLAKKIPIPETVWSYNMDEMMTYYLNGSKKYPGCRGITKRGTTRFLDIDAQNKPTLEEGDIIWRHMTTNDIALYNRQPSLTDTAYCAHTLAVIEDSNLEIKHNYSFQMNVIACANYNADFDGDQMNIIVPSCQMARTELALISRIDSKFISSKTSTPMNGQEQDSILGCYLMTRNTTRIDRPHAMQLYAKTNLTPSFPNKPIMTGREVIELMLPPINYKNMASSYKEDFAPFANYDPADIQVVIKNGKILSGVLDKSSIGATANSIFHVINGDYGSRRTISLIYDMQQIALAYLEQCGNSLNVNDFTISEESQQKIRDIESGVLLQSAQLTEKLNRGEIIPPIGKTVMQFYEEQQIAILDTMDIYIEPIMRSINTRANNLYRMVMSGSKGKLVNMYNINASIGQVTINGERVRKNFGYNRSMPWYARFDENPKSRGFISRSYILGQSPEEIYTNAVNSRYDIITKALSTSITGEKNRDGVKNLESLIINNHRFITINQQIVSFVYGDIAADLTKQEFVKMPWVFATNAQMRERYRYHALDNIRDKEVMQIFEDEFARIMTARDEFRRQCMLFESHYKMHPLSDLRPVNVNIVRYVEESLTIYKDKVGEKGTLMSINELAEAVRAVHEYCQIELPYVYFNRYYRAAKRHIPSHVQSSLTNMRSLIYAHLCSNVLETIDLATLRLIFEKISAKYLDSLISYGSCQGIVAAQCVCEPLSQYMLDSHHRSVSGGTKKDGIKKFGEYQGVKDTRASAGAYMILRLLDEYSNNKFTVQQVASNIETIYLRTITRSMYVYFEEYGKPTHPRFADHAAFIREFEQYSISKPPKDLANWCIVVLLDKSAMILKNISIEDIVTTMKLKHPDLYIVYSSENTKSGQLFLRIYFRTRLFRKEKIITDKIVVRLAKSLADGSLRGTPNIRSAVLIRDNHSRVNADGGVEPVTDAWAIEAAGSNLEQVALNNYLDHTKTQTDNIVETFELLGIGAARAKIRINFIDILSATGKINDANIDVYVDAMTCLGKLSPIAKRTGPKDREPHNILLRVGDSHLVQNLVEGALGCYTNPIYGVSAPLMLGSIPRIGTLYNDVCINTEFVQKNAPKQDDVLDNL